MSSKNRKKSTAPEPGSLSRRFFAYLIDWYVGALAGAIPISIIASQVTGDVTNQNILDLPAPFGLVAGALSLLFAWGYFVAVPAFVWPGQTLAKRFLGLRIATLDGDDPSLGKLMIRQVLGLFIIDGTLVAASAIWHQMLTIVTGVNFVTPLMYAGFAITLVNVAMIVMRKDRRCIHDLISGTQVVKAETRQADETQTLN